MTSDAVCMCYLPVGSARFVGSWSAARLGGVGFKDGSSYAGRVEPLAAAELPLMASSAREVRRFFCCWVCPGAGFALSGHMVALSSATAPKGAARAAEIATAIRVLVMGNLQQGSLQAPCPPDHGPSAA